MAKNKENQKRLAKEWYERNKELAKDRARQWALANPEKRHAIHRKNREANLEKHNAYNRKWFAANPDKRAALEAKRRSAQLQRTPPWLTAEHLTQIADFYTMAKMFQMYTGETYHVDHIEPLQGDNVSGLHVPWNLQILHYKENLQKSNRTPI